MRPFDLQARLRTHVPALVPGLAVVALCLVWAVRSGGFDGDTWYWGALAALAVLAATLLLLGPRRAALGRARTAALTLFALYTAWSYVSITWAQAPGVALDGSNRTLLYLLVFTLMTVLPWTAESALAALITFTVGVGTIAIVLLVRLASDDRLGPLIIGGRLSAPTGYFNATAALFTIGALTGAGLASLRRLPGPLRGLLVTLAGACLQLSIVVQSRGWLFTLPLVLIVAGVVARDRIRVALTALLPALMALIPVHRLLQIYDASGGPGLGQAAERAGREALVLLAAGFVLGTLWAWADQLWTPTEVSRRWRRVGGGLVAAAAIAAACAGAVVVTHGQPFQFISRQWHGFSQEPTVSTGSHFTDVGSGRYDFWRVALQAFRAHPVGGLGQDNFADYYVRHRHTTEEPEWVHSLELRLLTHTGIVGFLLFAGFLGCALAAAVRARRRAPPLAAATAGVALLPLVVWVVYGSVDWFWEMPALSGPGLGFLGMAGALAPARERAPAPGRRRPTWVRAAGRAAAVAGFAGCVVLLGFPYLSVRWQARASDIAGRDPAAALRYLSTAARLNPLDGTPGRIAGAMALQLGEYETALQRFRQSTRREPGGWFSWLGAGLAQSALGNSAAARRDFEAAYAINRAQPAITTALQRVDTAHPLTPAEAFKLLVVIQ